MKKATLILALAFIAVFLTGCSTFTNTSDAGDLTYYPKLIDIVDDYRPVYEVENKKVSGTGKGCVLFGIFAWGADGTADNARVETSFFSKIFPSAKDMAAKSAFYNACKAAECDYLTAARYEIQAENYIIFRRVTSKVTGFPVKLVGVKVIKKEAYILNEKGIPVKQDDFTQPIIMHPQDQPSAKGNGKGGKGKEADGASSLLKFIPPPFSIFAKMISGDK